MTSKYFLSILSLWVLFVQQGIAQTSFPPVDSIITLQNIEVKGKHFSQLSGGLIKKLNVDNNLSGVTGTTADALQQIPSFVTDIEGNTLFRGSSKSTVLLNGIPYGIMEENSGDVLIQLPAFFFNNVILSSAPDIEFIPDGSGSVLSLSSGTESSSPLLINIGAGLQERYNAGTSINLHPGKFNITGKYNYRKEYRERSFNKTQTTSTGTQIMNNNASARPDVHIADLQTEYQVSAHDKITAYGLYHLMDYSRYGGINNTVLNAAGQTSKKVIRHRYNNQEQEAYSAEARWQHTFSSPSDVLEVIFNYNNFTYNEDNLFKNENLLAGKMGPEDNLFINQDKHQYYVSAGYHKTFTPTLLFKGGYTGRFNEDNYLNAANDFQNSTWVPNASKSNNFFFKRHINMLYASVEKVCNDFKTELGVQGEQSWQKTKTKEGLLSNKTTYKVYPQIRLSYENRQLGSFILSYVQRTDRPLSKDLNPFTDTSDNTNITQGNPYLKPELVHLLELSYVYTNSVFRLAPNIYYRQRSNRIMDLAVEKENMLIWKKENIGNARTMGAEVAAYWFPLAIFSAGLSGNVYRDEIDGRTIGYNRTKSMVCWNVKADIKVNITPTTELQIDGFYLSDQLTPQGKIKSRYTVNAGASQYFMQRKLRANLSINNIFNSLGETTIIDTETLQLNQVRNRDAQVTWLTLTYIL